MATQPLLYHGEGSFYSHICRLALAEKGIPYKSRAVNMMECENLSIAYLREVNPKGTVPAMEHMGTLLTESKDIVEYVDTLPSEKPQLFRRGNSKEDDRVHHFWILLESLNIPVISYGSMYHRHLSSNGIPPTFLLSKRFMRSRLTKIAQDTERIKKEYPDIAPRMEGRRDFNEFLKMVVDEAVVLEALRECDEALEEVEEELGKQRQNFGDGRYWLCGNDFTVADIYLSCTLHRLIFVGQAERLFLSKRPLTTDYYNRVLKRETFARECVYANSIFWCMMVPALRAGVRRLRPFLVAAMIAAAGVYAYHRSDELREMIPTLWAKYVG